MGERVETKRRDARELAPEALAELRRKAVEAVDSGAPQIEVALWLGVSRRSVGQWVRAYRDRGEESFRPAQRGRRPGEQFALTGPQQERVLRQIVAGPPDGAGLPCRLWTRRAVAELIQRDLGIRLRSATVGRYLQRWGIDALSEPCELLRPADGGPSPRGGVAGPRPIAEELRVAWTRPRVPFHPDPVHALLAVTGRGVAHFLVRARPFDRGALDDVRERLRMQLARDVRMVVCSWPPERYALLDGWLSAAAEPVAWRAPA